MGCARIPGTTAHSVVAPLALQPLAELAHVALDPVRVVVAPTLEVLEVGVVVGHRVADHLALRDRVAALQPANQAQRRANLALAVEDLLVRPVGAAAGGLDHLDAECDVVEADRVPAPEPGWDEFVD